MQEDVVQSIIIERIKQAQEEESWIANLKEFLIGEITNLSIEEAKLCARIALDYEVDKVGLLFFCPRSTEDPDSRVELLLFGGTGTIAARFSASLSYKSRGRTPRYWKNIPTNPIQVPLERTLSQCPALCRRMW